MKDHFRELIEEGEHWQYMRGQQAEHLYMIGLYARKLLRETIKHEPKIEKYPHMVKRYCVYKNRQLQQFIRNI